MWKQRKMAEYVAPKPNASFTFLLFFFLSFPCFCSILGVSLSHSNIFLAPTSDVRDFAFLKQFANGFLSCWYIFFLVWQQFAATSSIASVSSLRVCRASASTLLALYHLCFCLMICLPFITSFVYYLPLPSHCIFCEPPPPATTPTTNVYTHKNSILCSMIDQTLLRKSKIVKWTKMIKYFHINWWNERIWSNIQQSLLFFFCECSPFILAEEGSAIVWKCEFAEVWFWCIVTAATGISSNTNRKGPQ